MCERRETGNAVENIMGANMQPQRLGLVYLLWCTRTIPQNNRINSAIIDNDNNRINPYKSSFGGLEVLAFGTQLREFKPGRSRRIFQAEKSSARLLRKGSKSRPVPCRRFSECKRTLKVALTRYYQAKFTGHFSPNSSTFYC
jgi:hypothetical protein